ncbi:MAG: hypothetical protein ACSHYF_10745 [Verrucomicrobiaceae bacterium]
MTCVPEPVIQHYRESRSLVSVTREQIDSNSVQGFIVDYDADWIVLQHIHDFFLDGYLLLRRADLTSMNCRATDAFQRHLLESDGILDKVDFDFRLPSGGLAEFLTRLPKSRILILEDETEDDLFLIGTFLDIEDECVSIRFFSGAGRWDEEPAEIDFEDITSVSFSTNYTLAYERHFASETSNGEQVGAGNPLDAE